MIEVNLLPGGRKRTSKGPSFSLPKLSLGGGGEGPDPYIVFFVVAAIIGIGYMGWAFMAVRGTHVDLEVRLEEERQDSIRFAAQIEQVDRLVARRDSIATRAAIIQQIDEDRFVWAHLLDEVGAAVPEFLWLNELAYTGDNPLQVRITGMAGSPYAITNFVRRLEASRFLTGATMGPMQEAQSPENPSDMVQVFEVVVSYEPPPIEELETVPLFDGEMATMESNPAPAGG